MRKWPPALLRYSPVWGKGSQELATGEGLQHGVVSRGAQARPQRCPQAGPEARSKRGAEAMVAPVRRLHG